MPRPTRSRRAAVATTLGGLIAAPLAVVATAVPAHAAPVNLTLVGFNDFHGRIDSSTTRFATAIESVRDANKDGVTDAGTLLLSGGDNIGASLFASAYNDDKPTIQLLNALGVDAAAVGNHEFDKGFPWFKSHVVDGGSTAPDGSAYPAAAFPYLGANVTDAAGNPVLQRSTQKTVSGVDVCIIGAVTQETPSLVSPAGIAGLTFGDPVAAVNAEADRLGAACDLTVAVYHEGAPRSSTSSAPVSQADQEAASAVFRRITTETSPAVDVIYNAHTHQRYAYNGSRPVIQSGQYGEAISRLTLTVDDAGGGVSAASPSIVSIPSAEDTTYPRVASIKSSIVAPAIAAANVIGDQAVGTITADVTRADSDPAAPGVQEERGAESTIGNMVADALRETKIATMGTRVPDIGLTNPGGLRADLLYAADLSTSPANAAGVVTFEEANSVLPFANNVSYVDVSGATLKKIFEQQWQPASASRPYLHLGVSKNVQTTFDPARPAGDRVTSIRIDGESVKATETYTVSTFSFLAAGGDNFTAFTEGKATDTGAIDRDLWIDGYLRNGGAKAPDTAKRQLQVTGLPVDEVVAGKKYTVSVSGFDITSLGVKPNARLRAAKVVKGKQKFFASTAVVGGKATLTFRARGGDELQLVGDASGTTLTREVERTRPKAKVKVFPGKPVPRAGSPRVRIVMKPGSGMAEVKGKVQVKLDGRRIDGKKKVVLKLKNNRVKLKLGRFAKPGTYTLRVKYRGNGTYKPRFEKVKIKVKPRR